MPFLDHGNHFGRVLNDFENYGDFLGVYFALLSHFEIRIPIQVDLNVEIALMVTSLTKAFSVGKDSLTRY